MLVHPGTGRGDCVPAPHTLHPSRGGRRVGTGPATVTPRAPVFPGPAVLLPPQRQRPNLWAERGHEAGRVSLRPAPRCRPAGPTPSRPVTFAVPKPRP